MKSLIALSLAVTSIFSLSPSMYASNIIAENLLETNSPELRSTLPYTVPIDGFIKGSSESRTKTQNMSTVALVAAGLAKIMGLPADKVLESYGTLVIVLQASGMSEVYYTRTEYHSEDNMEYYYKYDYYLDQAHNDYAGTAYSYVYTKWY